MRAAGRISQLGGEPDFNLATLARRAHTAYETFADEDLQGMLRDNLTAERIVITTYRWCSTRKSRYSRSPATESSLASSGACPPTIFSSWYSITAHRGHQGLAGLGSGRAPADVVDGLG
jgi:hypothetical protein